MGFAGLLAIIMNLALWRMNRRLKKHFPAVYVELGQPGFFNTKPSGVARNYQDFILFRRYRSLGDSTITAYGNIAAVSCYAALIIATFVIILIWVPDLHI
ncbi:MAG: hypothetical protein H6924_08570 [Alphaproteobacteria bacterium]|nr:hypothetical protein [Alphaproteobacteria bacterium]